MQTETPRFHAWLAAEKEAHEATRRLHEEMLRFAKGATPAAPRELAVVARAKRLEAHALFDQAMQEVKDLAASLHHRKILGTGATLLKPANAQHRPAATVPPHSRSGAAAEGPGEAKESVPCTASR